MGRGIAYYVTSIIAQLVLAVRYSQIPLCGGPGRAASI